MLDEIERRGVEPSQIIEEQRERMFLAREHAEEAPENHLEAVLRVLWRQIRNRRLHSDQEFQLGNEVDDETAIRAQRPLQGASPRVKLRLALAQDMADQTLKRLREGGVGNIAFVLVELAGREQTALRNERLVQLIDHRRLANAGIAGDKREFRFAARDDAVEGGKQSVDLATSAVQRLRD